MVGVRVLCISCVQTALVSVCFLCQVLGKKVDKVMISKHIISRINPKLSPKLPLIG